MEILKKKNYSYIRGFNYQPSYGCCGYEIWNYFNPEIVEREISLGKKYFPGLNTLRIWLSFDAFLKNPSSFRHNFSSVLKMCKEKKIKIIPVIFNGWHSFPDFGGISLEQIICYVNTPDIYRRYFYSYLEEIVGNFADDENILVWDLCNEPFNSADSKKDIGLILTWLEDVYNFCKKEIGVKAPITVGSVPALNSIKLLEKISDVITTHPYYAKNAWVKGKKKFTDFLDEVVSFANEKKKALVATETGWGSLNDEERAEGVEFELSEFKKRKIGFVVHLLHHTYVADGHRPEYGPITQAGYMAFIDKDGDLRQGHEVFNKFCGDKSDFKGKENYLEEYTKRIIDKCKVVKEIDGKLYSLYVPGADMKYPAFWIRDAFYIVEADIVPVKEVKDMIELILSRQNEKDIHLEKGLIVPAWSIPDHINFDGGAVYFPGTYNSGKNQGDGRYGFLPPIDDQYFIIYFVNWYIEKTGDYHFLDKEINGIKIIERVEKAFDHYGVNKSNHLCWSDKKKYAVDWGFHDTVCKTGYLLFSSVMRYESSLFLSDIFKKMGKIEKGNKYKEISGKIKNSIFEYFWDGSGYFLSSTGLSSQHDVFGTLFGIVSGIIDGKYLKISTHKMKEDFLKGKTVDKDGYVRGVPDGMDFSSETMWEKTISPFGTYQNGGFWAVGTGWYIYVLSKIDKKTGENLTKRFLNHILKGRKKGAPFEWKNESTGQRSGSWYAASLTLPLKFIKTIEKEEKDG